MWWALTIKRLTTSMVCLTLIAESTVGGTLSPDTIETVRGNTAFAVDLYRQLAANRDGNLFFSPYSISTALAMTYAGARGETETQMRDTMHFSLPQPRFHPAMGDLIDNLNNRDGYELAVANRLWGQEGVRFETDFLETTATDYGAELAPVDFAGDTEGARQTINGWTEEQTRGRIPELFEPRQLTSMTRLALTNAVYFKGGWKVEFEPANTRPGTFITGSGQHVTGPMMHMNPSKMAYRVAPAPDARVIEIPYTNDGLSMWIVLPHEVDGLPLIEQSISAEWIDEIAADFYPPLYGLVMPRFRLTDEFQLKGTLAEMGMPDLFSFQTDLSGISIEMALRVDKVVHKSFIDVNEQGSEATGATGVAIGGFSGPPMINVTHPFLFMIRDNSTGSLLFMGRVTDPVFLTAVPEPSSLAFAIFGAMGLLMARSKRRRSKRGASPFLW